MSSVFVGGGTPTLVPAADSPRCSRSIPVAAGAEVTVECNPDDVTVDMLRTYAAAGVNRVSIGVQSMVPSVLASLGRTHVPANVERAVEAVRAAGLPTFNLDLIYGGAGESLDDWRATLEGVLALEPPHVSAYALTIEAGTPLADGSGAPSRRRRPRRQVRVGRRPARPLPGWPTTRSATGRCPVTSAGTTCCTGSRATTAGSVQRRTRTATAAGGGTCARPSATSRPSRLASPTEAAGETLDAETRRVEGLQLALRMRDGVPLAALDADGLDGLVDDRRRPRATHPDRSPAGQRSIDAAALTGSLAVLHGRVAQLVRALP